MKQILLSLGISFVICSLSATSTYRVATNNKNIACTLETCSEEEAKCFFGIALLPKKIETGRDYRGNTIIVHYAEHPLQKLPRKYMPVKIEVTNNTNTTIYLQPTTYISDPNKCIVSKTSLLKEYPETKRTKLISGLVTAGAISLMALVESFLVPHLQKKLQTKLTTEGDSYTRKRHYYSFERGFFEISRYDHDKRQNRGTRIVAHIILFLVGGISAYILHQNILYDRASKNVAKKPALYKINNNALIQTYPETAHYFAIPPGKKFCDVFFIDLAKAHRSLFAHDHPKLIYLSQNPVAD